MSIQSARILQKYPSTSVCGTSTKMIFLTESILHGYMLNSTGDMLVQHHNMHSPYVLKYFKVKALDKGTVYIVTEKSKGTTLDQLMRHGCPSYEVVKELILKILKGFQDIHHAGILHRDICMQNINIEFAFPSFIPKIAGFNLLCPEVGSSTLLATNPGCIAPDVRSYADYDIKSEIWSIGILVYEILRAKFQPDFKSGLGNTFYKNTEVDLSFVPPCFKNFIGAALTPEIASRPASLDELINILHECLDERSRVMYSIA